MDTLKTLRIGTRGSALALWQAGHVQALLRQRLPDLKTEIVKILTSGDWKPADGEKRLSTQQGGKAQFAKEIEERLLGDEIDIAVHSMKDMDSSLPEGLEIPCVLPREEEFDAILLRHRAAPDQLPKDIADWPAGTTIGTSSLRRQAMLLHLNPALNIIPLRGNVGTRISKLRGDLAQDFPQLEATLLAVAGLKRLQQTQEVDYVLNDQIMLPAANQGIIGIEIASRHKESLAPILNTLHCRRSFWRSVAERSALKAIGGSCHTPIGLHAQLTHDDVMTLRLHLLSPDGTLSHKEQASATIASPQDAEKLGVTLAQATLSAAPPALLKAALKAAL